MFVFAWVSLVCVFQLLFLLMIIRIKFLEWVCNISFATFAVINLFCLYLFFIVAVAALPTSIQVVLFVFSLFVAYSFFASLSVGGWWAKGVISIVGVLFLANIAWFVGQIYFVNEPSPFTAEGKTSSPNIKIVDFKQKPNVYFISFDAMIPVSLAKKYLNIDNLSYQNFTKEKGFYRFRNAFSDGTYTRYGLNKLLAMDHDYFTVLEKQNKYSSLFVGLSPSPAFEIFKANGYTTNTYFRDLHMGYKKGPHVDNYKATYNSYFGFCENHPTINALYFGFFGACRLSWNSVGVPNLFTEANVSIRNSSAAFDYVNFVLRDFTRQLSVGKPFVAFMHIISPDHTPNTYKPSQFKEYRQKFLVTIRDETRPLMENIFNFIQANDPNAFIYFYSDHGQGLSRLIYGNEFQELNKKNKEFYIQDRYGILAAFYPPDVCAEYLDAPMMKPFVTNTMVLRQVIRCLADGEDPVIAPVEYRLHPYYGEKEAGDLSGHQGDEPGYYEDYLYE